MLFTGMIHAVGHARSALVTIVALGLLRRRASSREQLAISATLRRFATPWPRVGPPGPSIRSAAGCAPEPSSAEAHALKAEVAPAQGDFPEVKQEFNEARTLGYPGRSSTGFRAIWAARLGMFAEAEPTLTRLWTTSEKTDPGVDEALARIYLKTYRLRRPGP